MSAPTAVRHVPHASALDQSIRCSCGHLATNTRDGSDAAWIRFAGHVRHATTITTGARR